MKQISILAMLLAAIAFCTIACSSTEEKDSTPPPAEGTGNGETTGNGNGETTDVATFTVVNNSSIDIYHLYVSPSEEATWGDDVLGREVLERGDSATIVMTSGKWDVKVTDNEGNELVFENVEFGDDDYELKIVDSENENE